MKARVDYSLGDPVNRHYVYSGRGNTIYHWKTDRSASNNITLGFLLGVEYHFNKKK